MPRNGSGVYSYPEGTPGVSGEVIESEAYNAYILDVAATLNTACPIVAGGTGANNATDARTNLGVMPSAGGVMTGNIEISPISGSAGIVLNKPVAGQGTYIEGQTNEVSRWRLDLGGADLETGSNAGSNFYLSRYTDAGSAATALIINRATGQADLYGPTQINNTLYVSGDSTFAGDVSAVNVTATSYLISNQGTHLGTVFCGPTSSNHFLQYNGYWYHTDKWQSLHSVSYVIADTSMQVGTTLSVGTFLTVTGGITSLGGTTANRWSTASGGSLYVAWAGYQPGGGVWADSSDGRIKNVLGDYKQGLAQIRKLKPKRYHFKGNDTAPDEPESGHATVAKQKREFVGLVAQEIEDVLPEMITRAEGLIDGKKVKDLRMMNASSLIYALVNACKELADRVETLEGRRAK